MILENNNVNRKLNNDLLLLIKKILSVVLNNLNIKLITFKFFAKKKFFF